MHFTGIWRPKFTDLANKTLTKLNILEKMAVDRNTWKKAWNRLLNSFTSIDGWQ